MNKPKKARAQFWRSLNELERNKDFEKYMTGEFPESVDTAPDSPSRRRFVQLMGASFALAGGAAACRWPREELRPYTERPDGVIPGVPRIFNTAMELGGIGAGLAVTSFDGRPLKVDGNDKHPTMMGASNGIQQAQILELYDPDRTMTPFEGGNATTREAFFEFAKKHFGTHRSDQGQGLAFLMESSSSPTRARLQAEIAESMPKATWHVYESVNRDNEVQGAKIAFGKPMRAQADLASAKVILTLNADLFDSHPDSHRLARGWGEGRNPETGDMNRLYAVESRYTTTGASADNRLPLRSEQIKPFVMALESALRAHPTVQASVTDLQSPAPAPSSGFLASEKAKSWIKELVRDLVSHRGRSAVLVGSDVEAEVHAIGHRINKALGNVGKTISYTPEADEMATESLNGLLTELNGGSVKTLVVMGANPVYSAPSELNVAEAFKKADMLVHVGDHLDETGDLAKWHIPRSHFLETWGDVRAFDGTVSIIQPTIDPLQISFSDIEVLSLILGGNGYGKDLVTATFAALKNIDPAADDEERKALEEKRSTAKGQGYNLPELFTSMDREWRKALDDGFIEGTAALPETPELLEFETTPAEPRSLKPSEELENGELELTFYADASLYDGRYANNGWLQEVPDYMTKVCWDNVAIFSPNTAKKLGVHDEDLVNLAVDGKSIEAAALVIPGQATNSVAIALGYGRTVTGRLGRHYDAVPYQTGFDTAPVRPKDGSMRMTGLTVSQTGKTYDLAAVQDHWSIDELGMKERENRSHGLVRATDLVQFKKRPDFVKDYEHGPQGSKFAIYKHPAKFDGHRWAMAIDLTKCIGCNACSISCQAENNIPVVGKEDVRRGREMHWLRIDRYFQGDPEEPQVASQPISCMHCENAPCEQVCPVAATVHDEEGLNAMVYNRCIGTRYCSNNCPFKVRRFNWFQYHESDKNPNAVRQHMMYNPEVSVRFRGVMEKCTYCTQRIQNAKIYVKKVLKREMRDGDVKSACEQVCPTGAIVFGDLADKTSRVSKLHERSRTYGLLGELNLGVRTKFLAKVTNPNDTLAPKQESGGHHGGHH